jgi:hypothetical protein
VAPNSQHDPDSKKKQQNNETTTKDKKDKNNKINQTKQTSLFFENYFSKRRTCQHEASVADILELDESAIRAAVDGLHVRCVRVEVDFSQDDVAAKATASENEENR